MRLKPLTRFSCRLQFTYRGQTATLQSSADIAAWIEERKKRYPTKARAQEVAERKRLLQEAQKASSEALKQKQEKRKSEQRERRKQVKADGNRKEQEKAKLDPQDAALKAKIKAEKLRRRLVKEERRVEKAEAKAEEARLKAEATQTGTCSSPLVTAGMKRKREDYDNAITAFSADNGHPNGDKDERVSLGDNKIIPQEEESPTEKDGRIISLDDMITKASTSSLKNIVSATPDPAATLKPPVTPREHPSTISDTGHREFLPQPNVEETDSSSVDTMSISSSSSEPSEDDDNTSSSGSSSDEDAPDEAPSKRDGPERVPPPKRERPKSICKAFLKTGRCKRGGRCRFLHELPERGSSRAAMVEGKKTSGQAKQEPRPKRKRLYELVCCVSVVRLCQANGRFTACRTGKGKGRPTDLAGYYIPRAIWCSGSTFDYHGACFWVGAERRVRGFQRVPTWSPHRASKFELECSKLDYLI